MATYLNCFIQVIKQCDDVKMTIWKYGKEGCLCFILALAVGKL